MDKEEKTVSLWVETFASEESVAKHADAIAEMVHKSRLEEGIANADGAIAVSPIHVSSL